MLLLRALRALGLALVLGATLFLLAAWIGSSIPRNADWREPYSAEEAITILVQSNGVHTALILPLVIPARDWRGTFPASDIAASARPYSHVSISWGERQVFLNTPTWWDLSPGTALRVIGIGGDGLVHVAHYVRPAPDTNTRSLRLRRSEYARLVTAIDAQLGPDWPGRHYPGYGSQDVFYETGGRYTVLRTCNQWTSDMLAAAGVRTGRWTPLAGGVMKWVPQPRSIS